MGAPINSRVYQILVIIYEARKCQVDGVSACPTQVGYQRALDTSMTRVQHTVLLVPFKKYYLLARIHIGHNKIWLRHGSNTTGHDSDTTRTQPSTFFAII